MNKFSLINLLSPYILESWQDKSQVSEVYEIYHGWDRAHLHSIVFYEFNAQDSKDQKERKFLAHQGSKSCGLLITNESLPFLKKIPHCVITQSQNFKKVELLLLQKFYPINWTEKKLIGITGTDGKTSTTEICRQIANLLGHRAFGLGGLGLIRHNHQRFPHIIQSLTTPMTIDLYKVLYEEFKSHEVGFIEVSSHGIHQERIYGLPFSLGAWTSFSQDHLDYHPDMEAYFSVKKSFIENFFANKKECFFVPRGEKLLLKKLKGLVTSTKSFSQMKIKKLPLFYQIDYNQRNLELALTLNEQLFSRIPADFPFDQLRSVLGRFEKIEHLGKFAFIDFAHTPGSIKKVCQQLKTFFPQRKLILVFGCGGDRDNAKRPLMGKMAEEYADKIYITSDNPRTEDPKLIIEHIKKGLKNPKNATIIADRLNCIQQAFLKMSAQDILLITGKGHEDYQIIGSQKLPYSDRLSIIQIK